MNFTFEHCIFLFLLFVLYSLAFDFIDSVFELIDVIKSLRSKK